MKSAAGAMAFIFCDSGTGYNNGILEGSNNKIKVMKRISFGYRTFYHFRNRIFITQNLAKIKTA
ncbi:transposase [Ureibacillus thermophilus]|nr:transposase [Ureibacillus thermophilus]